MHRHHLHDALYLIKLLLKDMQLSGILDDCLLLEENYRRMLDFISKGGKDEDSHAMRSLMLENALKQLIVSEREYRLQNSPDELFSSTAHKLSSEGEKLETIMEHFCEETPGTTAREEWLDKLFYAIWTSGPLSSGEGIILQETIDQSTETEQCTIVSALSMGLQEYCDKEKLCILLHYLDCQQEKVKIRAVMGIVLCSLHHPEDIQLLPAISQALTQEYLLRDDIQLIVEYLNLAFLLCLQTQQAREKIQNDILPNFMKMAKDGRIELGFNEAGEIDLATEDVSPKESKELRSNMKEFFDMQRDGIDMNANNMLATRNLPFFKELPHWFLPFDKNRTELHDGQDKGKKDIYAFIEQMNSMAGGECDTDRYSTAMIMLKHMGKEMKDTIKHMLHVMNEGGEPQKIISISTPTQDSTKTRCRNYMQQLYRVFTMHPNSKEWHNPFRFTTNWLQNPILSCALAHNREALHHLSDFLVKYKNYKEAEDYLNQLVKLEGCDAEIFRYAAYCKQQQGHFGAAIPLYCQADILDPNHSWTLEQMQLCYAQTDQQEKRLECLLQLEQLEPDNAKFIIETGLCLIQLKQWQEASQRFFRLELEERHVIPSQRAIAWCSLLQGKTEQALRYYGKIMATTAVRWQDYINAGHAAWVQGNTPKAIEYYKEYLRHYLTDDPKITDALTPFNKDNELLLSLGKKQHEIDIMHDIILNSQCIIHNSQLTPSE